MRDSFKLRQRQQVTVRMTSPFVLCVKAVGLKADDGAVLGPYQYLCGQPGYDCYDVQMSNREFYHNEFEICMDELGCALLYTLSSLSSGYFSYSVAISGDMCIVGAPATGGSYSGKAHIFDVTTGALLHTLDNPNAYGASMDDYFGDSVAISGNKCIVGAYGEDDAGGNFSGKAYIFDVTTGALLHTLDNPNVLWGASALDYFGYSVAISGDECIVGAHFEGNGSGKAYIFDVTTGALLRTLDNPNAYGTTGDDYFGYSVAISGDRCIVGAYGEDEAGNVYSGKAYIFDVTTGVLLHILNNPNAYNLSAFDYFGCSVAISGNKCIVGAYGEDEPAGNDYSGKAYIFDVTTGALLHTLDNPSAYDIGMDDYFGYSVAISGNKCIVGAYGEDDAGGDHSGKAYIFDVTTGVLQCVLDNPNPYGTSMDDYFGYSVAISGNKCIVGAYSEDEPGKNQSGKAYIFNAG